MGIGTILLRTTPRFVFCIAFLFNISPIHAQTDPFKIGMFGVGYKNHIVDGCNLPYQETMAPGMDNPDMDFKTSILNVLKEDGFNVVNVYGPNEWSSEANIKYLIRLIGKNGMQVEISPGTNYKPTLNEANEYLGYGFNDYNNCNLSYSDSCKSPYSYGYFKPNIGQMFAKVFTKSEFSNIIWGYHICEEASFLHPHHIADNCQGWEFGNPEYFLNTETPPQNVEEAMNKYKTILSNAGITHHKMVIMEANHAGAINQNCDDIDWQTSTGSYGQNLPIDYDPDEYVTILDKNDERDVFFEGSYFQWEVSTPWGGWNSNPYSNLAQGQKHYLGFLESIDFAKQYAHSVHDVIATYQVAADSSKHLHTNKNIPNANFQWFQAYTSIIHGVEGIWFWWIEGPGMFEEPDEWSQSAWPTDQDDRFDREYFPRRYKYYISNLARELNYLNKRGLLNQSNSEVYAKRGQVDGNGIVPACTTYINNTSIPANYFAELNPSDHISENYGLRYTIRTNGDETVMIIANMLPVAIQNIKLDFSQLRDQNIRDAVGVDVLFEFDQPVASKEYKVVDKNNNYRETINEEGKLIDYYYKSFFGNKELPLSFGPLDVHVLRFISDPPYESFVVFPNPTSSSFSVFIPGNPKCTVELFDVSGKKLKTFDSTDSFSSIPCSEMASGIYFLKIKTDEKIYLQKVVIQK